MAIDFNVMAGGEAGQGVQSVGMVLAKVMAQGGLCVFADQDYENRVRGGHNFFRVRVSDKEVLTISEKLDILLALNKETIDLHHDELKSNGVIIFDQEQTKIEARGDNYFNVPFAKLAEETVKNKLMTNTVAVGAAIGLAGYDFDILASVLRKEFTRHGEKIAEDNVVAARAGFDFAHEHSVNKLSQKIKPISDSSKRMLLHGNEALALGAMVGGCKFIAGYPMTPTTPILEYLADKGRRYNVVAVHAEDEIAAINMSIGAAYAGVRAMVATSGGGFCLMVEGLALAGITETPIVVVLGQRPGPATGMPTRTEQGELWFALHAGHGEFPRAILAPATAEESFHTIIKAFNLAEKYQTPVIVLTDHYLATSYATVKRFDLKQVKIDRGELLSDEELDRLADYKRHLVTESGISPRALPGQGKALVVTDSDEHNEAGHLIEDAETRNQQNLKRLRKQNGLKAEISSPKFQESPDSEFTLIGWGSTYGAIREAADLLKKDGMPVNVLHISEIWPFPVEAISTALDKGTKNIVIENNATAQMANLIRRETGYKVNGTILKSDGRPFSPQEIVDLIKKEVS
ncbi:MAG: 2-oxoacid:acceptor oxidoreductase subunit alpha [Dehalococcoidia bacterium]|nr:2-oxoacid:acceptor oxidoreductase subunit alpha [Dehalococcoidia bacterium]